MSCERAYQPERQGFVRDTVANESQRRGWRMLGISVFCLNVGLAGHMAMNSNYLHELIHVGPWQMGYLESTREACGIASFALIALLAGLAEPILAAGLLGMIAVGLTAYSGVHTITGVVMFSVVWSMGFHLWLPLSQSMTLGFAESGHAGRRLGQMRAIGSVGVLLGLGCVAGLLWLSQNEIVPFKIGMRPLFIGCGVVVAIGIFASLRITGLNHKQTVRPWAFKRKYALYYALTFFEGWRKQIFLSFATFTLVLEYDAPVLHITLLMAANNAVIFLIAPTVGRFIDRMGERVTLSVYYTLLAGIFVLYALIPQREWLYALYIIDNVMFVLAIALPSYLNRIADEADRRQCLAMGVTMNHIAAVIMPLVGGLLWQRYGYQLPFYCGAGVAVVSLVIAQALPSRSRSHGG